MKGKLSSTAEEFLKVEKQTMLRTWLQLQEMGIVTKSWLSLVINFFQFSRSSPTATCHNFFLFANILENSLAIGVMGGGVECRSGSGGGVRVGVVEY